MQQMRDVTGTAFVVAEFRAEENFADQPLYRDLVVEFFLSDDSRRAAAKVAAGFPHVKEMVKIRTRYFDDVLDCELASGCRQVVILGAGLDTRAVRKSMPGVTYFEIDDGATLALKENRIARGGIRANVKFITGNYVRDGLVSMLRGAGFDLEQPTYVLWEGNTMYLPTDSDRAVMRQLTTNLRDFRLSFDYFAPSVITKTTGEDGLTRMVENFAEMGAPWLSGFDNIEALAADVGLHVIDDWTTGELYAAYRGHALTQPIFGPFYSVCTLTS